MLAQPANPVALLEDIRDLAKLTGIKGDFPALGAAGSIQLTVDAHLFVPYGQAGQGHRTAETGPDHWDPPRRGEKAEVVGAVGA